MKIQIAFGYRITIRFKDATPADSLPGDETLTGPRSGGQSDNILPTGFHDAGTRFGRLIGLPIRQNVKSLVWYPPDVFQDQGYAVPTDWGELQALIDRMVDDGFVPWCLGVEAFGASGWPATDWVEDILLRNSGPAV